MGKKTPSAMQRVWEVVGAIPEGRVASYGQIAKLSALPGGARRVGRVLGLAPDRESLPWHRVVKADGQIAIPAGKSARTEQINRLRAEGVTVSSGSINMRRYQWQPDLDELVWGPLSFIDSIQNDR